MRRFLVFLEKRPTLSFIMVLMLLFGVIALATWLRSPVDETTQEASTPKTSRVFSVAESGTITATARVKKSSVIDIVAATSGIIETVPVRAGQRVGRGALLATITTTYGVNPGRLSAEKATLEADFTERMFSLEKEINARSRKIQKANPQLSDRDEKNALARLELELERLRLNRETSKLSAAITAAGDALLRPKSPSAGWVEYIGVRPGETVTAGTLIATLRSTENTAQVVAALPATTARYLQSGDIALLRLNGEPLTLTGGYLAQGENTLGLRSLTFPLPPTLVPELTEGEFLTLTLPLRQGAGQFFVPLDVLYSGLNGKSVLILQDGKAVERQVTTGIALGSSVLVTAGLDGTETILLDRSLLPGDMVEVIR